VKKLTAWALKLAQSLPRVAVREARAGLGPIAALYCRASTSYHIH
jgi:hypothetical protein